MATVNTIGLVNCGNTANTLFGANCDFKPGIPKALMLIPYSTVFTATQIATMQSTLQALLINDSHAARGFLIGKVGKFKDNSTAEKTEDLDGYLSTTFEGSYDFMWQLTENGKCGHQSLRGFSYQQNSYKLLVFDDKNQMWCTNMPNATSGAAQAAGFTQHEIFIPKWSFPTVSSVAVYPAVFRQSDITEWNENFFGFNLGFNPLTQLKGLNSVNLGFQSVISATVTQTVTGYVNCSSQVLAQAYPQLAAAGAWVVKNVTAGTTITPTAVALSADGNSFVFTIPSQTTGNILSFQLAAPSVLTAAPYNAYLVSETPVTSVY